MIRLRSFLLAILLTPTFVGCDDARPSNAPTDAASVVISVRNVDCGGCGEEVAEAIANVPGVYEASFDRQAVELTVHYDAGATNTTAFFAAVTKHGFEGVQGPGQGAYIPAVDFDPGLDVRVIAKQGEAVSLRKHLVPDKVTVFDFYAPWCKPCRKVDAHFQTLLAERQDVALRKLNVVDWDSDLAAQHLQGIAELPYVIIYGKDGKRVEAITGLKLDALDTAIEAGAQ
jgi:thiol-disulfide isomerase/thioredoxin